MMIAERPRFAREGSHIKLQVRERLMLPQVALVERSTSAIPSTPQEPWHAIPDFAAIAGFRTNAPVLLLS